MALVSPGVEVQISDESAYGAPGAGTSPLIVLATRENKADPTGSASDGIAKYTKSTHAGEVVRVTSQREVTQFFGNPTFRTNSTDVVVQGDETNEYGLMAAYSYLGQGNTAYIVRADVDLGALEPTTATPTAAWSTVNTNWLDTDASTYGIHTYNSTLDVWQNKIPTVEVIAGAAGTAPSATVVTGGFHVVISEADNTIEYYAESGGAWAAISGSATFDEHFSTPAAPSNGDVWVKTTSPGNGLNLVVYEYITTGWVSREVLGVGTGASVTGYVPANGTSSSALTASASQEDKIVVDTTGGILTLKVLDASSAAGAISSLKASIAFPTATAADGQVWFKPELDELDIYVLDSGTFVPASSVSYSANAPSNPSAGDVWVNTLLADTNQPNERSYPDMRVYNSSVGDWVQHDNTDQTTARGVLFGNITDTAGDTSNSGAATTITGAPDPLVFPDGMLAVNMGQSSNTVREYDGSATEWRNAVANHADGSGAFGRFAQHKYIAAKMQAVAIGEDLRDPSNSFTLLAAPNFPELTDELVALNSDRGETGFIIIDTPMRKNPTDAVNWVQNQAIASENGDDG